MATRATKKKPTARKAAPRKAAQPKAPAAKKIPRSSVTGRALINQMSANTIFRQRDVPPVYRLMTDEARVSERGVRWGWRQWITLLPRLEKHIKAKGREGLAGAIDNAQQKLLPGSLHRSRDSLVVGASPSARMDVIALVAFLATMRRKVDYDAVLAAPAAAPAPNPQHAQAFEQHVKASATRQDSAGAAIEAQPMQSPAPAAIAPLAPDLAAALQIPIAAFLPALRSVFVDAIAQAFRPQVLQQLVRDAVAEVVGGVPAAQPAQAPNTATAQAEAPAQEGDRCSEPEPAAQGDQQPDAGRVPGAPDATGEVIAEGDTPHDLRHQIAKAMGIPLPEEQAPAPLPPPYQAHRYADEAQDAGPRHSVIVVGAGARVQRDLAKLCGAAFRFTFKRPFEFNDAKQLPITTDALLLVKKRLNKALYQVVTRHSINVRDIENDTAAALFALRELFPHAMPAQPIALKRQRVTASGAPALH